MMTRETCRDCGLVINLRLEHALGAHVLGRHHVAHVVINKKVFEGWSPITEFIARDLEKDFGLYEEGKLQNPYEFVMVRFGNPKMHYPFLPALYTAVEKNTTANKPLKFVRVETLEERYAENSEQGKPDYKYGAGLIVKATRTCMRLQMPWWQAWTRAVFRRAYAHATPDRVLNSKEPGNPFKIRTDTVGEIDNGYFDLDPQRKRKRWP